MSTGVHTRATRFEVTGWPGPIDGVNRTFYVLNVEWRGGEKWCLTDGFGCYRADGQREHEPIPSGRDDEFLSRTRFPFEEAMQLAERIAPTMRQFSMHHGRELTAAESWEWERTR